MPEPELPLAPELELLLELELELELLLELELVPEPAPVGSYATTLSSWVTGAVNRLPTDVVTP